MRDLPGVAGRFGGAGRIAPDHAPALDLTASEVAELLDAELLLRPPVPDIEM